jgi:hypothetical protein
MPPINGTPTSDTLTAPAGNSEINGFAGVDTLVLNFRLLDATFSWVGTQLIIDTPGSHVVTTGLEVFSFTDGTVNNNDGNPLVDDLYFYSQNHGVWTAQGDADTAFANGGWQAGKNPNAFFNTKLYLMANPDVAAAGVNPLDHFHTIGWKEGRLPSFNFDDNLYLQANPDVAAANIDPLSHFLAIGRDEGRQPFNTTTHLLGPNGFDYIYYLQQNPDVAASGIDAYVHYALIGWKEGRNPNAYFDTKGYLATYTDVAAAGIDPLAHYAVAGWKEGRNPSPAFDSTNYLDHYIDVKAANVNPLEHFLRFGENEGRTPMADSLIAFGQNAVLEGAAVGTEVTSGFAWGLWTSPLLTFSLVGDTSGGGFAVNSATGAITVADSTKIDFETSGLSHTYTVSVKASLLFLSVTLPFTIIVGNVAPSTPTDTDADANLVLEGAAIGTLAQIDASSTDPNGPPVTYSLTNDAGGRFTIDPSTGIVTVNGAINFEAIPGGTLQITVAASDGTATTTQNFTINIGNVNEEPQGADNTKNLQEDAPYTFTAADFGFSDPLDSPANNFAGVVIGGIAGAGALTNGINPVANGTFVSAADIAAGNLKFTPAANANGSNYASFNFQVRDDGATGGTNVNTDQSTNAMTINVAAVNDPPTGGVTITGTATEDQVLTAVSTLADNDGLGTLHYQWQRDSGGGFVNVGLDQATYTLGDPDVGATFRVVVSYTDGQGNAESSTSAVTAAVAAVNDPHTGGVTITGTATEDQVLTAVSTLADVDGLGTLHYQWQHDVGAGFVNVGLDQATYTLGDADVGGIVRVVVSYTDGQGFAEAATSAATAAVANVNDVPTGGVTISGTATEDQILTAVSTLADGDGLGTLHYQWQRDSGGGFVNVGLDQATYTLGDADVGATLRVVVSYTDGQGTPESSTSAATAAVAAVNDPHTGGVTITGTATEDQILTAVSTLADVDGLGVLHYDWQRDSGGGFVSIGAADQATYTLGDADAGATIRVVVSYTDGQGFAEFATSAATAAVAAVNDPHTGGATINGTATEDQVLTAVSTLADVDGLGPLHYQWQRDSGGGFVNVGLDQATYTLGDADVGGIIRVVVSYTDGQGFAESATSAATAAVANINDVPTGGVTISGTATEDQVLTAVSTLADDDGLGTLHYQWQRNGANVGLDQATYTLSDADVGASITVIVSYTDGQGTPESATSGAVGPVGELNDEPTLTSDDIDPNYSAGVALFQTTSISVGPANESTQNIDQLVLTVTNVGDDLLSIDGSPVNLTNGFTVPSTLTNGMTVTVGVVGTTATVTIFKNGGISAADMQTLVNGITYTNNDVGLNETARDVTITSIRDTGGTAPGDDTANPGITSTVSFNEPPEITSNLGGPTAVVSIDENTTAVADVDATDPDSGPSPIVYSIVPGGDGGHFAIDPNTGVLTFSSAPNAEIPTDTDTNNTYVVTVRASDGAAFDDQTITVTVNNVNEAPVITSNGAGPTAAISVNENQTAVTDVDATDQDVPTTLTYSKAGGADAALFNIDPSTGVLTFVSGRNFETPTDADTNNTYVVIVRATDNGTGFLFDEQTITVTVDNVNEQPTLVATGATVTYTEDNPSENHSVTLFTAVAASAVEPGQNLDELVFTVSNVVDTSEQLSIDGTTIPLAAGSYLTSANGISVFVAFSGSTATVTVGKSGGIAPALMQTLIAGIAYSNTDESPTAGARVVTLVSLRDVGPNAPAPNDNILESIGISATVTVAPVNDAPVVAVSGNPPNTFIEGAALATGTPVFVDTAFTVSDVDSANLASATVSITGGLQAGDVLDFTPQFGITDINVAPDILALSGPATLAEWETVLRSITFATSNQDPTTSRTISIQISDGTSNSTTVTKNVTITPLNDEPTLTATGGAVTFTETSLPDFPGSGAVDLFSGPDASTVEAGQVLNSLVVTVSNVGDATEFLVAGDGAGTAIDLVNGSEIVNLTGGGTATATVTVSGGTATITFTKAGGFTETQIESLVDSFKYDNNDNTPTETTHTITVTSLTDSGGTADGGDDTGAPTSVSTVVTVEATNDEPVANNDTFTGLSGAIVNTTLVVNAPGDGAPSVTNGPFKAISGNILANDTDAEGATLSVVPGTITTAQGGTVVIEADGDFVYYPEPNTTGTPDTSDSFTYTVTDGNPANENGTDTGTVTINFIPNSTIWYVDASYAGGDSDGSAARPFTDFSQLNGVGGAGDVDAAGDTIFVFDGTVTGNLELESGQKLFGERHGLTAPDGGGGAGTTTLLAPNAGAGATTINGTVTLAGGGTANNIQGINFGATTGFSLQGDNVGNATVNTVTAGQINNTAGGAINIDGSDTGMNLQFTSVSTGGGTNAILFDDARGTFNAGGGTLSNASGNTVSITGNNVNDDLAFTYGGAISDDGNLLVNISGQSGGTKDFNGALTDGAGAGGGISLSGNIAEHLTRFDGGVNLSTGGANALVTNNAGTLAITGSTNTITTTTGTALNVTSTTIHADDLTFQSIASSGAANGIVLNGTGTAAGNGGLIVTGTSTTDGSGGTIANSTGVGISLTNTKDVNLSNMNVSGGGNDGIGGSGVNGLTLTNLNVTNNGNAVGERGIDMTQLSGSGGIANSTISGSAEANVRIENDTANLTAFNVTGTTIATTNFTTGDDGFLVLNTGSASMTVSVTGSTFTDNKGDHFQAASDADASGTMNITFNNNTLTTTALNDPNVIGGGITINTSGSLDITFQVNNNNLQQAFDDGININLDPGSLAGASMTGTINGNTIGTSGVAASGSESSNTITVAAKGQGVVDIDIMNNNIFEWGNQYGILLQTSEGSADLFAKVTGNTLHATFPNVLLINGIHLNAGATAGDNGYVELVLTGNDVTGEGNPAVPDTDIRLRQRFNTTVELPGYAGANNDTAAVNAFVAANNDPAGATPAPSVSSAHNVGGGGGGFIGGTATPLLAASGGIGSASNSSGDHDLTLSELAPVVATAISYWAAAGLTTNQLAALSEVSFGIDELTGSWLGSQANGHIKIDADAAGYGWFVDATPWDSAEFAHSLSATQLQTDPTQAPAGHMDLLTVVMHEIGHVLGLDHSHEESGGDLMSETLVTGERRLPDAADVAATELRAPEIVGQNIVGGFDAEYYLAHNPDVAAAGVDPHFHFNVVGWQEGRDPNAYFDTEGYLAYYTDVAAAGVDPLYHYEVVGWREGRDPSAGFDTQMYLAANPDVAAANVNPLEHFLQFGVREGRAAVSDGLWG